MINYKCSRETTVSLSHFFTCIEIVNIVPLARRVYDASWNCFPFGKKRVMVLVQTYILFALLIHLYQCFNLSHSLHSKCEPHPITDTFTY